VLEVMMEKATAVLPARAAGFFCVIGWILFRAILQTADSFVCTAIGKNAKTGETLLRLS
jgi:hypothetical protein